jgi:site-specific DNA-methyltransferase (adenine-specific)
MDLIPDGSVDLILADPPYGTTACKWDAVIPFEPMWKQVWRVLKPNGAAVFTASQPFMSVLIAGQIERFKHDWVWQKSRPSGHLNAKKKPMLEHEGIAVFARLPVTYNPQMRKGLPNHVSAKPRMAVHSDCYGEQNSVIEAITEDKYPKTILPFTVVSPTNNLHPTQKPVALMEYLIRTYTNEGETVLDFTMGSGTTGVACMNTGRRFIGIEQDEGYFKIAQKRIETAMGILVP